MISRRHFLRSLGVATSALVLGFRPKIQGEDLPDHDLRVGCLREYIVGYKGKDFLRTGVVNAPYLPVFVTSEISKDVFISRKRSLTELHPSERIYRDTHGGYENYA